MNTDVIYIFKPRPKLVELLNNREKDLAKLVTAISWVSREDDLSYLNQDWINHVKLIYANHLMDEYAILNETILNGSVMTVEIFDKYWILERYEIEGDLNDLESMQS